MQIFDIEVFSRHIGCAKHMLDVPAMCRGLRTIALVGNDVLPQWWGSKMLILIRVHDDRAVLLRVVSARHCGCTATILGISHSVNRCTTPSCGLQWQDLLLIFKRLGVNVMHSAIREVCRWSQISVPYTSVCISNRARSCVIQWKCIRTMLAIVSLLRTWVRGDFSTTSFRFVVPNIMWARSSI